MSETIVYLKGGDQYMGSQKGRSLAQWKKYGRDHRQKYLYKGFRYWDGKKNQVVVFDNKAWGLAEINRRKNNGFLGIRSYYL